MKGISDTGGPAELQILKWKLPQLKATTMCLQSRGELGGFSGGGKGPGSNLEAKTVVEIDYLGELKLHTVTRCKEVWQVSHSLVLFILPLAATSMDTNSQA